MQFLCVLAGQIGQQDVGIFLWKDNIWGLHSTEPLSILALLISELPGNGLIHININKCLRKPSLYDLELYTRSDPHQCCLHLLLVRDSNGDFLNAIRENKKEDKIHKCFQMTWAKILY